MKGDPLKGHEKYILPKRWLKPGRDVRRSCFFDRRAVPLFQHLHTYIADQREQTSKKKEKKEKKKKRENELSWLTTNQFSSSFLLYHPRTHKSRIGIYNHPTKGAPEHL
mmetsp:Transcript_5038/g.10934  ORF Transcript_5038/g.10934 Transcript_5038/m.10934 type:complete len:109 (-) Transcript_5038:119-445(-)